MMTTVLLKGGLYGFQVSMLVWGSVNPILTGLERDGDLVEAADEGEKRGMFESKGSEPFPETKFGNYGSWVGIRV